MSLRRTKHKRFKPAPNPAGQESDEPSSIPFCNPQPGTVGLPKAASSILNQVSIKSDSPRSSIAERTDRITLWLRRADQLLLGTLLIALVLLLVALRWKLSGGGRSEIEIVSQQPREYFYAIDINRASWVEWSQLDGIGEKLARRIVQDRAERGPFLTIDEIGRVRGLGPKLIDKLRPFLKCVSDEIKEPR